MDRRHRLHSTRHDYVLSERAAERRPSPLTAFNISRPANECASSACTRISFFLRVHKYKVHEIHSKVHPCKLAYVGYQSPSCTEAETAKSLALPNRSLGRLLVHTLPLQLFNSSCPTTRRQFAHILVHDAVSNHRRRLMLGGSKVDALQRSKTAHFNIRRAGENTDDAAKSLSAQLPCNVGAEDREA
eukprot:2294983-Pleurochrysis_carterae.AAC.1